MALGERRKTKKSSAVPKLMLTSMMDMFTIVLIFLLFSFSDRVETIKLDNELELPRSSTKIDYDKNLKLILSKSALMLDDEIVAELDNGEIKGFDQKNLKTSILYKRLREHFEMSKKIEEESTEEEPTNQGIIFLCDKGHEFKVINQVMKTAGLAGYPNFQFAVLQN
ncbi:MAG: biopolymer transporter ExbD [Desulfobacteraceae bacterium]|jgi:biopolymer transport protein ExbD